MGGGGVVGRGLCSPGPLLSLQLGIVPLVPSHSPLHPLRQVVRGSLSDGCQGSSVTSHSPDSPTLHPGEGPALSKPDPAAGRAVLPSSVRALDAPSPAFSVVLREPPLLTVPPPHLPSVLRAPEPRPPGTTF